MVASVAHYTREISGSVQFNQPNAGVGERAKFYTLISQYDLGDLTGAVSLNLANSNQMKGRLTGNSVFSVSPAPVGPCDLTLFLRQDAVGGRIIDWTALNPNWVGSGTPAIPTSANAKFIVSLKYDGTEWWGAISYIGAAYGPVIRDGGDDYVKPYTNGWGLRLYGASSGSTNLKAESTGRLDISRATAGDSLIASITDTNSPGSTLLFRGVGVEGNTNFAAVHGEEGINNTDTAGNLTLSYRKRNSEGSALTESLILNYLGRIGLGEDSFGALNSVVTVYRTQDLCPLTLRTESIVNANKFEIGLNGSVLKITSGDQIVSSANANYILGGGRAISWSNAGAYNPSFNIIGDLVANTLTITGGNTVNFLVSNVAITNGSNNLGLGTTSYGTNAQNVLAIYGGTAPTTSVAFGGIQLYAVQIAGNDWSPHFRLYNGNVIKFYKGLKANFNNFSTLADIVSLLQSFGLAEI